MADVDGGPPPEAPGSSWSHLNPWQKGKRIVAQMTVEPIVILYSVLAVLSGLTTENLAVQKACRISLNQSAELCGNIFENDTAYPEVSATRRATRSGGTTVTSYPCGKKVC